MRLISLAPLATSVTLSSGLGFIGAGSDVSGLDAELTCARKLIRDGGFDLSTCKPDTNNGKEEAPYLPIGVGFLLWSPSLLSSALPILLKHRPLAIWLFAPPSEGTTTTDPTLTISHWITTLRSLSRTHAYGPHIWLQIGSVASALSSCTSPLHAPPDVLVVQGADAGGHGLLKGAGLISLLPEVIDAVTSAHARGEARSIPHFIAAGGIADGRGVAAALALGAEGVCMGTRYLGAEEAQLAEGYRREVLRAGDGGQSTVRSKVYDTLRGTTEWPAEYAGRGVVNRSYVDAMGGVMSQEENKRLYAEALEKGNEGWGLEGRLTTYAGTAVGLVTKVQSAKEITEEVREQCRIALKAATSRL